MQNDKIDEGAESKFQTDINLHDVKQELSDERSAETNQHKAEKARQAAFERIREAQNPDHGKHEDDYIDFSHGPVETDKIQHQSPKI
ncbi:MAG: hypothetical protein HUJ63_01475 [Enterococcus sp.]|nr:hypothetical protein [Enterococcus sp.]